MGLNDCKVATGDKEMINIDHESHLPINERFSRNAELCTSTEILEAIAHISDDDRSPMDIWTAPNQVEKIRIYNIVTSDGTPSTKFFWGENSTRWAPVIPMQEDLHYLAEREDRMPELTGWVIALSVCGVFWAIVIYFAFWSLINNGS